MRNVFLRKYRAIRRTGVLLTLRVGVDRLFLTVLQWIYKFHPWHASAPLSARPYRYAVARMVNELRPLRVVEVGCGLGGNLALINAPERFGYDLDDGAIRAARFLHRSKKISFIHGDISTVDVRNIDVLILVNWIHEISPQKLEEWLVPVLPHAGYLLLDAIDPNEPGSYRYKHDFSFLEKRVERLAVTRVSNEGRSFQLFRVVA